MSTANNDALRHLGRELSIPEREVDFLVSEECDFNYMIESQFNFKLLRYCPRLSPNTCEKLYKATLFMVHNSRRVDTTTQAESDTVLKLVTATRFNSFLEEEYPAGKITDADDNKLVGLFYKFRLMDTDLWVLTKHHHILSLSQLEREMIPLSRSLLVGINPQTQQLLAAVATYVQIHSNVTMESVTFAEFLPWFSGQQMAVKHDDGDRIFIGPA